MIVLWGLPKDSFVDLFFQSPCFGVTLVTKILFVYLVSTLIIVTKLMLYSSNCLYYYHLIFIIAEASTTNVTERGALSNLAANLTIGGHNHTNIR